MLTVIYSHFQLSYSRLDPFTTTTLSHTFTQHDTFEQHHTISHDITQYHTTTHYNTLQQQHILHILHARMLDRPTDHSRPTNLHHILGDAHQDDPRCTMQQNTRLGSDPFGLLTANRDGAWDHPRHQSRQRTHQTRQRDRNSKRHQTRRNEQESTLERPIDR